MAETIGKNSSAAKRDPVKAGKLFPSRDTYLNKVNEVLEGRVKVRLLAQLYHFREVLVVDVGVDAEKALQDRLGYRQKISRKRNTCLF